MLYDSDVAPFAIISGEKIVDMVTQSQEDELDQIASNQMGEMRTKRLHWLRQ